MFRIPPSTVRSPGGRSRGGLRRNLADLLGGPWGAKEGSEMDGDLSSMHCAGHDGAACPWPVPQWSQFQMENRMFGVRQFTFKVLRKRSVFENNGFHRAASDIAFAKVENRGIELSEAIKARNGHVQEIVIHRYRT